jgi:conjugative relaxase-like TrwC/TraI family protein
VLSVAKLTRGREGYYLATLGAGREGSGGLVEPDGRWLGRAAATLGLVGSVDATVLSGLLAGFDPISGRQLSPYHDRVRVVAYDCTYSSPKSVSLLHALGPEDVGTQVRMGHERATEAALGYLERRGARVRRRPAGLRILTCTLTFWWPISLRARTGDGRHSMVGVCTSS